jgi:hypothetical protein
MHICYTVSQTRKFEASPPPHPNSTLAITMLDLYGSNVPPVLHTRQPTCLPTPVPPLIALDIHDLINILAPSLLFLLILPWLIVHIPRNQPTRRGGYLIHGWGGEETPMFWTTPTLIQYPHFNPIDTKEE